MTSRNFITQLQRQLGFLRRSCDSYDSGFDDEAIRIAVIIRVLLHNTRVSTSLLSLLNAQNINLLSTCPEIDISHIMFSGGLSWSQLKVENDQCVHAKPVPMLDSHKNEDRLLSISDWWEQVVYVISEGRLTRKQIVLTASNQDGGAHVDKKLTREYEALQRGIGIMGYSIGGQAAEFAIENLQLSDLRQMGYEILNSPDVLSLAR